MNHGISEIQSMLGLRNSLLNCTINAIANVA